MNPKLLELLGLEADATDEDVLNAVMVLKGDPETEETDITEEAEAEAETVAENADEDPPQVEAAEEVAEPEEEEDPKVAAMNALTAERDAALNAVIAMQGREADSLIGQAIESGRLTKAEEAGWRSRFETDHSAAVNAIGELKPVLNTKSVELGEVKQAGATARERISAINAEVDRRKTEQGLTHDAAWNAVKHDPAWKSQWAAMQQPQAAE